MRIAIELNNIVRDVNTQALKYFIKGYDKNFDDEKVDKNCTDLLNTLPFKNKADRAAFRTIDYPYELYGCARTMHKHLHVEVDDWNEENDDVEIIYFSLNETRLTIQSTYFFLSKGSRVRTVIFPKKAKDIWDYCDVVITTNKDVVNSKPENKVAIVIKKNDNLPLQKQANLVYDNLLSIFHDTEFRNKLSDNNCNENKTETKHFVNKILNSLKSWKIKE